MNKVKTNLFALAAGVLISPALMAADAETPSDELFYSDEYLSTAGVDDTVASGDLAVTLGAEYTDDDVITWAISGGAIEAGFGGTVSSVCIASAGGLVVDSLPGIAGLTFGILNSDADGAQYRVTIIDSACDPDGVVTTGATVVFSPELTLDAQSVDAANTITATYSATTETLIPLDTSGDPDVDLIVTGSQFDASVSPAFNGIVDVNADRLLFVDDETDDSATWNVQNDVCPEGILPANCTFAAPLLDDVGDQELTVVSDWSWVVDANEDPADGIQFDVDVFGTLCENIALTATELTADCDYGINDLDIFTDFNGGGPPNTEVLPKTTFVSSHVLNFTGIGDVDSSITVANISLGRWVLNGFQALVPYMPYGANISQVIYLVNRGPQVGDVTVEYTDQFGNQDSLGVVASLPATSTLKLGQAIQNALPANLRAGGRLGLTITANVPATDAQINTQYNVSGNRAFTLHEDNRPIDNVVFPAAE